MRHDARLRLDRRARLFVLNRNLASGQDGSHDRRYRAMAKDADETGIQLKTIHRALRRNRLNHLSRFVRSRALTRALSRVLNLVRSRGVNPETKRRGANLLNGKTHRG